ncbi:hypothetical protein ACIO7M_32845 [Streptomyces toxytricini]|uniref:Uncharacterized protein n=1 Tax=Streptomyces toxytricini TaxID=67369 RepID=A0ABW8EUU1_STRT5
MAAGPQGLGGPGCGGFGEAVQALGKGADEAGPALGAAHRAVRGSGQAPVGFLEDDVGQGAGGVVGGQLVGGAANVGGDRAGGAGQLQRDLVEVRQL